jgi:hypothetical protein
MSVYNNLKAFATNTIEGKELIVKGEVNAGSALLTPKFKKRAVQNHGPRILLLDVENALESTLPNFKSVEYNEPVAVLDQFDEVWIFRADLHEANVPVERV